MKRTERILTNKENGLYFCGVVTKRRRRKVPKDNPTATVVTYEFTDEAGHVTYYVDDYEPESYFEVGQYVETAIRIKPYVNKTTNRLAYSMSVKKPYNKESDENGEIF